MLNELQNEIKNLVSVVVPCYNYAKFLTETVESILAQTYHNWECIIVDDGSTDNTKEVAHGLMAKDNRIKYIYQNNAGLSAARNTGIINAKGEFIQLLDADDIVLAKKLELHTDYLNNNPNIGIVYSGSKRFITSDKIDINNAKAEMAQNWMPRIYGEGKLVLRYLIHYNIMVVNSALVRKRVFQKVGLFNTELKSVEDFEFWIRCAANDIEFGFIDNSSAMAIVRAHSDSMMTNTVTMIEAEIKMRKNIKPLIKSNFVLQQTNLSFISFLNNRLLDYYLDNKKYMKAMKTYLKLSCKCKLYYCKHHLSRLIR